MPLPPAEEAVAAAFHAIRAKRKKAENPVTKAILERIRKNPSQRGVHISR